MHDIVHIIKITELYTFRMVAVVNFMLYEFYLNFEKGKDIMGAQPKVLPAESLSTLF